MASAYESRSAGLLHARRAVNQIACSAEQGIWGAHQGCSVLAGLLLVEQGWVPLEVASRIERHVDQLLESAPTIQGGNENVLPLPAFAASVVEALAHDAATPKELGHDVIYAGYVLRALEVFRIEPSDGLRTGLLRLIRQVKASGPGYITVNGRNEVRFPPPSDDQFDGELWPAFAGLVRPAAAEAADMQLGHVLTHGHAIELVRPWVNASLVEDLKRAHRSRVLGLEAAAREQRTAGSLDGRRLDPRTMDYWEEVDRLGDMHGHAFKYAYSLLDLKSGRVSEADLEAFGRILWPS